MSWTGMQDLAVHHKKTLKTTKWWHFTVLWSVTLKIGTLSRLGLLFPVVRFIYLFDQTLAEQLYRDKGLLRVFMWQNWSRWVTFLLSATE